MRLESFVQDYYGVYQYTKDGRLSGYIAYFGTVKDLKAPFSTNAICLSDKGTEHIIQFAFEGWTISDLYSLLTSEPATYNIEALENAELVLISKAAHDELLQKVPRYETYT